MSEKLETYTKNLMAENEKLKGSVDQSHNTLIESAKKQVNGEMALAQRQYKEAYESGESQIKSFRGSELHLTLLKIRLEKVLTG